MGAHANVATFRRLAPARIHYKCVTARRLDSRASVCGMARSARACSARCGRGDRRVRAGCGSEARSERISPACTPMRPASPGSRATSTRRSLRRKASNKPVLLYWGAQWCPPCKQLKSAVFNRPGLHREVETVRRGVSRWRSARRAEVGRCVSRHRLSHRRGVQARSHRDHAHRRQHGSLAVCRRARRRARRRAPGQGRDRARREG